MMCGLAAVPDMMLVRSCLRPSSCLLMCFPLKVHVMGGRVWQLFELLFEVGRESRFRTKSNQGGRS